MMLTLYGVNIIIMVLTLYGIINL